MMVKFDEEVLKSNPVVKLASGQETEEELIKSELDIRSL